MSAHPGNFEPIVPTIRETELAKGASRQLTSHSPKEGDVLLRLIENGQDTDPILVPASAFKLLIGLLTEMSKGHAVNLIPHPAEFTTQQAADFLNVSRPYLVRLLDEGKIRHHKVGTHRRVRLTDLIAYKHHQQQETVRLLDELAAETQELGLGY